MAAKEWHDLGNDSNLGHIINQGDYCTYGAISVTNSLDIMNKLKSYVDKVFIFSTRNS